MLFRHPSPLVAALLAIEFTLSIPAAAQQSPTSRIAAVARKSIVYLQINGTNADTGAVEEKIGTGVIISSDGYLLTAAHNMQPQTGAPYASVTITGRVGGKYYGNSVEAWVIDQNSSTDLALLKLANAGIEYVPATPCPTFHPESGDPLLSFGFPMGEDFTPMPTTFANFSGSKWHVTSDFTFGTSGGPIYNIDGRIVALIQGGLPNTPAVRFAIPINLALPFIQVATGMSPNANCGIVGPEAYSFLTNNQNNVVTAELRKVNDLNWTEFQRGQATFHFTETHRDQDWITLTDESRDSFSLLIPVRGGIASMFWPGRMNDWQEWTTVKPLTDQ